jgi:hypothetical protein
MTSKKTTDSPTESVKEVNIKEQEIKFPVSRWAGSSSVHFDYPSEILFAALQAEGIEGDVEMTYKEVDSIMKKYLNTPAERG